MDNVRWWRVKARAIDSETGTPVMVVTYFALVAERETAEKESLEAIESLACDGNEIPPELEYEIVWCSIVESPPQGALYQIVESSKLWNGELDRLISARRLIPEAVKGLNSEVAKVVERTQVAAHECLSAIGKEIYGEERLHGRERTLPDAQEEARLPKR